MRCLSMLLSSSAIAAVALSAGCNNLLGIDDVGPLPADASVQSTSPCLINSQFDLVTSNNATSSLDKTSGGFPSLVILLNTDAQPDALGLLLRDNSGGHGVVNAPGTYSLTAADSVLSTCAICVRAYANFDSTSSSTAQTYMALGQGTLSLTKADAVGLTGSMANLKLRHVDLTSGTTDINDGCTVSVTDVEFEMTYSAAGSGARAPARFPEQ